jgi:hypothetical protein
MRVINAFEPVAQSVEHVTFNHGVVGSKPTGLAIIAGYANPLAWRAVAKNNNRNSGRENTNRRASLVALGVVIVLFVIGWVLTRELYSNSKIEDCVLSGRTNCVPVDTPSSTY